jgi:hypothetical protein
MAGMVSSNANDYMQQYYASLGINPYQQPTAQPQPIQTVPNDPNAIYQSYKSSDMAGPVFTQIGVKPQQAPVYQQQQQAAPRTQPDYSAQFQAALQALQTPPRIEAPPPPARISRPTPVLEKPGAAFARAKDVSGRTGQAALKALHDIMTRRGFSDSGIESEGESQILSGVQQHQAGAEYDAANRDTERQNQFGLAGYEGDLGQRSGDLGYQSNIFGGNISQRGQDIQALLQLLNLQKQY